MSIRGIEARHEWTSPAGVVLTLGDTTVWPRYELRHIAGRHAKGEHERKADPNIGRLGETSRRGNLIGKTETWEGRVRAKSLVDLRTASSALVEAFGEPGEGTMRILPKPGSPDPAWAYTAEPQTCDVDDEQTLGPWTPESEGWERPFTLTLRLEDPRYYEELDRTAETIGFVPAEGMILPAALPRAITAPALPVGTASAANGPAPVDPIIDMFGYAVDPGIVNDTLGVRFQFKPGSLTLTQNQVLRADFAKRTLTIDGQPVSRQLVDWTVSGWWDAGIWGLRRGVNLLRYRPRETGAGAKAVARWRNASYG